jgi:hypothetical protein
MAGIKSLRKLQIGKESTAGTPVAATTVWRGEGTGVDNREVVFPAEDVGIVGGVDRAYTPKLESSVDMAETPATFEQLPYILEAGIAAETPTQDGAGTDYIYEYAFPTTAQNVPQTYTIEHGDDQQAEEIEYCHVTELTIAGAAGEAVNMSATWVGRQSTTTTFTGALTPPTVEEILFGTGALYIDGVSTYPATTAKSNTLIGMELSVTTGMKARFTGDHLYFSYIQNVRPEIILNITFEHDSTAVAEIAAFRAGTARSVRLKFEGSTVGTPGTTYSSKTLLIDLVGKWESFEALGEQDGNDIVTGTLRCRYNATAGALGNILIVNELSALA